MPKPLVSVIMSAYNAESFIRKSIQSVLEQTYPSVELIVCDDGSTDRTREIIKTFPAVRYIYQDNQGQGAGRNNAVGHATGEYLAFIDADDCWTPEKLDVQIALFEKNKDIGAVYCDMEIVDVNNTSLGFNAKGRMKRGYIFDDLLAGNYMCGLSTLVVRAAVWKQVGGFSDHRYCQDFVFLLKVAEKYAFDFSEKSLVYYLVHDNNITGKIDISYPEQISFYKQIPLLHNLTDVQKGAVEEQLARLYFTYALLHFRRQNFSKTASILKEAKKQGRSILKSRVLSFLNTPLIRQYVYDKV
jgi:glycosyltransferase involved in cell wall biosynthesis